MKTVELGLDEHGQALTIEPDAVGFPYFCRNGVKIRPIHVAYLEGTLLRKVQELQARLDANTRD